MELKVETCSFVNISDVFKNCTSAWQEFCNYGNHPFTWGDNNRSLINKERLLEYIEDNFNISSDEEEAYEVEKEWVTVKQRLATLSEFLYIDLES